MRDDGNLEGGKVNKQVKRSREGGVRFLAGCWEKVKQTREA